MSCTELLLAQDTQAHMNRWWDKPLSLCRNLWQRTARASFCTSVTSVRGPEAFQSTYCGRGVGMPRALAWRWKDPVTLNWKISMQRRVSCLSLTMVRTQNLHVTFRNWLMSLSHEWFSESLTSVCPRWGRGRWGRRHHSARKHHCLPKLYHGEYRKKRAALPHGRWGEQSMQSKVYILNRRWGHRFLLLVGVFQLFLFSDWIYVGLMTVSCRVSLWKARKTSRRSWANSCCSVSSSLPSLHSGQVGLCVYMCMNGWVTELVCIPFLLWLLF